MNAGDHLQFRQFFFQSDCHSGTCRGELMVIAFTPDKCLVDAINTIRIFMKAVVAEFVLDV